MCFPEYLPILGRVNGTGGGIHAWILDRWRLIALGVAGAAAPATADDCHLYQFGAVDMSATRGAALVIPVTIEGKPTEMAIDTGSVLTGVDPERPTHFI